MNITEILYTRTNLQQSIGTYGCVLKNCVFCPRKFAHYSGENIGTIPRILINRFH